MICMVQTCRWNSPHFSGYLYINRSWFHLKYTFIARHSVPSCAKPDYLTFISPGYLVAFWQKSVYNPIFDCIEDFPHETISSKWKEGTCLAIFHNGLYIHRYTFSIFQYTFIGWVWGGPAAHLYQLHAREPPPPPGPSVVLKLHSWSLVCFFICVGVLRSCQQLRSCQAGQLLISTVPGQA